jgi:hypothetical protein
MGAGSLEGIINSAWVAYKNNYLSFIAAILLSGVIICALVLIGFVPLFFILVGLAVQGMSASEAAGYFFANLAVALFSVLFAAAFVVMACIAACALQGGMAAMAAEAIRKGKTSYSTMFDAARSRWKSFFGVSVLVTLIALLVMGLLMLPAAAAFLAGSQVTGWLLFAFGILLIIPAAVLFGVLFSFVYFAVWADRLAAVAAVKASMSFGRKNFWDVLIIILFFAVLSFIAGMLNAVTYVVGSLLAYFVVVPLQLLSLAALYLGRKKGGR